MHIFLLPPPSEGGPSGRRGLAIMSPVPETPRRVDPLTPRLGSLTCSSPVTSARAVPCRRVHTRSVLHVSYLKLNLPKSMRLGVWAKHPINLMLISQSQCDWEFEQSIPLIKC